MKVGTQTPSAAGCSIWGRIRRLIDLDDPAAGWVEGFVRPVEMQELINRFDPWEEVDAGLYCREQTTTRAGGRVWVYVYNRPLPPSSARAVRTLGGTSTGNRLGSPVQRRRRTMASNASKRAGHNGPTTQGRVASSMSTVGQYLIDRLDAPGRRPRLRHPRRLRAGPLQADRGEPDQAGGHDPRGQRRVRRRRLCPDPRPGLRLRDLLRGRALRSATASPGLMPRSRP